MTQFEAKAELITDGKFKEVQLMQNLSAAALTGKEITLQFTPRGVAVKANMSKDRPEESSLMLVTGLASALVGSLLKTAESGHLSRNEILGVYELLDASSEVMHAIAENLDNLLEEEPAEEEAAELTVEEALLKIIGSMAGDDADSIMDQLRGL